MNLNIMKKVRFIVIWDISMRNCADSELELILKFKNGKMFNYPRPKGQKSRTKNFQMQKENYQSLQVFKI